MTELLNDLEEVLSDLLQAGADTGAAAAAKRLRTLASQCESCGLHTGSILSVELAAHLEGRSHQLAKDDLPLTETLCRIARYLELCHEKLQEEAILDRWQCELSEKNPPLTAN